MPAGSLPELITFIGADNSQLLRSIGQSKTALVGLAASGISSMKNLGGGMITLGSTMNRFVTTPLLAATAAVGVFGGGFEKSMLTVQAVTSATAKEMALMTAQAEELGLTTKFSARQAADAQVILSKAGKDVLSVLAATPKALQLAAAADLDLAGATEILTNVMAGFGIEASELANVNDVLVKTFISSKTNLVNLGQAFKFAGPTAKLAGLSFAETAATLGFLGNAGLEATLGGTALRGILTKLIKPAKESKKILDEWNITIADMNGELLPIAGIMGQFAIAQRQVGNEFEFTNKIMQVFQQRASAGFVAVLEQGAKELAVFTKALENAGGTAKRIADIQMKGFFGGLLELKSAAEGLSIRIGRSGLLGDLEALARTFAQVFRNAAALDPVLLAQATKWALIAAAAGPVLFVTGKILITFAALATGMGLLGLAIVSLVGKFAFLAGGIGLLLGAAFLSFLNDLGVINLQIPKTRDAFVKTFESIATNFKNFVAFFKGETDTLTGITKTGVEAIAKTWLSLKLVFVSLKTAMSETFSFIKTASNKLAEFLIAGEIKGKQALLGFLDPGTEAFNRMEGNIESLKGSLADLSAEAGGFAAKMAAVRLANSIELNQIVADFGAAPEKLRGNINEFVGVFDDIMVVGLQVIKDHTPEFISTFIKMLEKVRAEVSGMVGDAMGFQAPDRTGISPTDADVSAFPPSAEALEGSLNRVRNWAETFKQIMEETSITVEETLSGMWVDIRDSFSDAFKGLIQGQKNFASIMIGLVDRLSSRLLDIAFQGILEHIIFAFAKGKANAIAAAPSPFLIPLFLGTFLAFWSSSMSDTPFSSVGGGGGGGDVAPPPPSAIATEIEEPDLPEAGEQTIVLEFPDMEGAVARLVVSATRKGFGDGISTLQLVGG